MYKICLVLGSSGPWVFESPVLRSWVQCLYSLPFLRYFFSVTSHDVQAKIANVFVKHFHIEILDKTGIDMNHPSFLDYVMMYSQNLLHFQCLKQT